MKTEETPYIPELRFPWLTRFYDAVLAGTLKEEKFKALVIEQAGVCPGHRVLDIGCGTATLTVMLKRTVPEAHVVGIEIDPEAL